MVFYHNTGKVASRDVGTRVVAADVKNLTMAYFVCLNVDDFGNLDYKSSFNGINIA